MADSLVPWKCKRDLFDDETDEDDSEVRSPNLVGTLQDVQFIRRDETNATAMRHLGFKWWDKNKR